MRNPPVFVEDVGKSCRSPYVFVEDVKETWGRRCVLVEDVDWLGKTNLILILN